MRRGGNHTVIHTVLVRSPPSAVDVEAKPLSVGDCPGTAWCQAAPLASSTGCQGPSPGGSHGSSESRPVKTEMGRGLPSSPSTVHTRLCASCGC